MSDSVNGFCDGIHEQLEALEGRMDALKANIGTTWHSLHEKLDEVRRRDIETRPVVMEARNRLQQWIQERGAEVPGMIEQSVKSHETGQLAERAGRAEEFAGIAIMLARASIDDAERMILEAIAARLDADAASVSQPE